MIRQFANYVGSKKRGGDEQGMRIALVAAEAAKSRGDAARGAALVFPGLNLSDGNTVFSGHDPLGHAEINVLNKACRTLNKSLRDATMYVTTEPCSLCFCALHEFGVRELVFGCHDVTNGFLSSGRGIKAECFDVSYLPGVLAEDCYNVCTPTLRENLLVRKGTGPGYDNGDRIGVE